MSRQGLAFNNITAIHIPFRFFNTAPWMGLLSALVLLSSANNPFASQWSPALLTITHLFTLGFMSMIMLGAMFQVLPVISGETIPGSHRVATLVHLSLIAGTLLLTAGFFSQHYGLFWFALPMLLLCFSCFLLSLGSLLIRKISGGASIFTIRLAAVSLFITIVIGVLRAANYVTAVSFINVSNISQVHMAWGLLGWVLLLIMGVSYQVIPMFHVTPNYSKLITRTLPGAVFTLLVFITVSQSAYQQNLLIPLLLAIIVSYAAYSINLLLHRKRKIIDITVNFWRMAMVNLILACGLFAAANYSGPWLTAPILFQQANIVIGILFIFGFACSVIMGMLQKIIPFLIYMYLQRRCMTDFELLKTLPHMGIIIPLTHSRWQFRFHLIAVILLLLAVLQPVLTTIAALLLAIDFCWLGYCIARATLLYLRHSVRVNAVLDANQQQQ